MMLDLIFRIAGAVLFTLGIVWCDMLVANVVIHRIEGSGEGLDPLFIISLFMAVGGAVLFAIGV